MSIQQSNRHLGATKNVYLPTQELLSAGDILTLGEAGRN